MPSQLEPPPMTSGCRQELAPRLCGTWWRGRARSFAIDVGGRENIADVGGRLSRRGVPTGFDQENTAGRVLRHPCRQRSPGRPGSHYSDIGFANVVFANVRMAHQAQIPGSPAADTKFPADAECVFRLA